MITLVSLQITVHCVILYSFSTGKTTIFLRVIENSLPRRLKMKTKDLKMSAGAPDDKARQPAPSFPTTIFILLRSIFHPPNTGGKTRWRRINQSLWMTVFLIIIIVHLFTKSSYMQIIEDNFSDVQWDSEDFIQMLVINEDLLKSNFDNSIQGRGEELETQIKLREKEFATEIISPTVIRNWAETTTLNWEGKCKSDNITVLFAVMSSPDSFQLRKRIRDTYGSEGVNNILESSTFFFVGKSESRITQMGIFLENEEHRDIVEFDLEDFDNNGSSLKSLTMLHWVDKYCTTPHWIVKVDENIFFNPFELEEILNTIPIRSKSYFWNEKCSSSTSVEGWWDGNVLHNRPQFDVVCSSMKSGTKWKVCGNNQTCLDNTLVAIKENGPNEWYPPHCHGALYVIHACLVPKLLQRDKDLVDNGFKRHKKEEVYVTGFLAEGMDLKIQDISDGIITDPESLTNIIDNEDSIFTINCSDEECQSEMGTHHERLWFYIADQYMHRAFGSDAATLPIVPEPTL